MKVVIKKILSKKSFGVILSCKIIDHFSRDGELLFVKVFKNIQIDLDFFIKGQYWEFEGDFEKITIQINGFNVNRNQLEARKAKLIKPSNHFIKEWMVDNVQGIGVVKANNICSFYGANILRFLNEIDVNSHSEFLSRKVLLELKDKWDQLGNDEFISFIDKYDIPVSLASKALRFYNDKFVKRVAADPYVLLSFGDFKLVDKIARESFLVSLDDNRRIVALIDDILVKSASDGHTFVYLKDLEKKIDDLMPVYRFTISDNVIDYGVNQGVFSITIDGNSNVRVHSPGMLIMERFIFESIQSRQGVDSIQPDMHRISNVINNLPFSINSHQINALNVCLENKMSIIFGGAGVGKTTLIKSLVDVLSDRPIYLMALTGRASARISEATGIGALTIASFLLKRTMLEDNAVVVIDESSMVGTHTIYRIFKRLPSNSKLVLVGDRFQLPPIEPGLPFHSFYASQIPQAELNIVTRQSESSNIPVFAKQVKDGVWSLPDFSDVVFIGCAVENIPDYICESFNTEFQILCPTNRSNSGAAKINKLIQEKFNGSDESLLYRDYVLEKYLKTDFKVNDKVIFKKNLWDRGLQNGSLGVITKAYSEYKEVKVDKAGEKIKCMAIGEAIFDGVEHLILEGDLEYLDLAYAVTVHKAQGSQFDTVIIPIYKSRVLDRVFLYTAITRAVSKVILIGCEDTIEEAIINDPVSFNRNTYLDDLLRH